MGIYTGSTRYFGEAYDYASEIPANEAYDAALGCAHILADCQKNDMSLFESAIYSDIAEVSAYYNEGVQVVNENAFTNVIKKIIEMFKKLLGKIKGIFNAFIAKLRGSFQDGKKLVKKYEKQILKYSNWNKFKLKGIRKPKAVIKTDVFAGLNKTFAFTLSNTYAINQNDDIDDNTPVIQNKLTIKQAKDKDSAEIQKIIAEHSYINGFKLTDDGLKTLHEDAMEYLWEDEETLEGEDDHISSSFFTDNWIKGVIADEEKTLKHLKKSNENAEKLLNKIIDDLSKVDTKLAKLATEKGNDVKNTKVDNDILTGRDASAGYHKYAGTERDSISSNFDDSKITKNDSGTNTIENVQKYVHALQTVASAEQEVCTKCCAELLVQYKFAIGQGKKIWTAAAAFSSVEHKNESYEYFQALGESVEDEFYMNMESIH